MQTVMPNRRLWEAAIVIASVLATLFMIRSAVATGQAQQTSPQPNQFRGRVLSGAGASVVGGPATNPGQPVPGATVYLVPVTAMDLTTRITASAIYAAPFPAEAVDEPLEDAIRLRGKAFPQAATDAQGNFVIPNVPDGRFFVHVTPASGDTEHLPGGNQSRVSYSTAALANRSMTIELSSSPSATAHYTGSSSCLTCHKNESHWQQTAHKLGFTVPQAPGPLQDFSRHPEFFSALQSFPVVDEYTKGTRLELGDYDASRGDDKFKLRTFGDSRLPIEEKNSPCGCVSIAVEPA